MVAECGDETNMKLESSLASLRYVHLCEHEMVINVLRGQV